MSSLSAEMNTPTKSKIEFKELCHKAVKCRKCFEKNNELSLDLEPPKKSNFNIAQPRWIGSNYWMARPRVLIMMLNPGSGDSRKDDADVKAVEKLRVFRNSGNGKKLDEILKDQKADMGFWGNFFQFYGGMGLQTSIDKERIAFANFAWCATDGNKYPSKMLKYCFENHTKKLVELLMPHVVILSGSPTHKFEPEILKILPKSKIIQTLHYAHRESKDVERKAQDSVKKQLGQGSGWQNKRQS
jgi:hypothetical protein